MSETYGKVFKKRDLTLDLLKMAFAVMIVCRHLFNYGIITNGEIMNLGVDSSSSYPVSCSSTP